MRSLKESIDQWDSILIYLISEKFDASTQKEWESELLKCIEPPTQVTLLDFLEKRCHFLEKIEKKVDLVNQLQDSRLKQGTKPQPRLSHAVTQRNTCSLCKGQHVLFSCKSFLDLSVQDRIARIKQLKLCFTCLKTDHMSTECKSSHCSRCDKFHNTLLHIDTSLQPIVQGKENIVLPESDTPMRTISSNSAVHRAISNNNTHKVLATAVVYVIDSNGNKHNCVALLDGGSQSNFMTTSLCRRLNLATARVNIPIIGINQSRTKTIESTTATIQSRHDPYEATISFLLLPKITDNLPSETLRPESLNLPRDIAVANPRFYQSKKIDILLGVDLFWDLICNNHVVHPHLYKTRLGYVVAGQIEVTTGRYILHVTSAYLRYQNN